MMGVKEGVEETVFEFEFEKAVVMLAAAAFEVCPRPYYSDSVRRKTLNIVRRRVCSCLQQW